MARPSGAVGPRRATKEPGLSRPVAERRASSLPERTLTLLLVAALALLLASVTWFARCSLMTCIEPPPSPPAVPAHQDGATSGLGLTQVALPHEASSDPTYYSNSHRLAQTAGGRLMTVFGSHANGVQLAWRDAGSATWEHHTTGDVGYGQLLWGTGTGDWPASLTVVPGHDGAGETAVVVWSGQNHSTASPVSLRVLTDLDSADGPRVGPAMTLAAPPLGAARPDVGVEVGRDGTPRVLVTWSERTAADVYTVVAAWLGEPHGNGTLIPPVGLHRGPSGDQTATVATTPSGVRVASTTRSGVLQVFGHDAGAALDEWWATGPAGGGFDKTFPSAVGLESGEVLVASTRGPAGDTVVVHRFAGPGQAPAVELELPGYIQPDMAVDAPTASLVAVRLADGSVISRTATADQGWSADDRVEMSAEGGDDFSWPDAIAGSGGSHVVARGPGSMRGRSSVIAFSRDD